MVNIIIMHQGEKMSAFKAKNFEFFFTIFRYSLILAIKIIFIIYLYTLKVKKSFNKSNSYKIVDETGRYDF